ncbi:hypothetical protein [Roseomonas sp. BN140053]|uniref:hypothetical protein n=1 Tax=Roseomonas sp. BN140053 TaxID=3391898 RepID=UPI0039ECAC85
MQPSRFPLPLGAFAVGEDSSLSPREPGTEPALRFLWRGHPCRAALGAAGLQLSAEAGRVPSTAGNAAAREPAFAALAALPGELPAGWNLALLPDHRVRLDASASIAGPTTAPAIVAAMVRFALALDPYLERLASAGIAGGASGTPSTCPG